MKNKKSIKKTILLSAITAIAFGSIAVTTSYALFTDSAETNVTVTAGKVDVEVALGELSGTSPSAINADGTIPEDATSDIEPNDDGVLTFANGGTAKVSGNNVIISNIAPGDSVKVPLTFTNNSTIAIKYKGKYSVSGSSKYEVTFNGLDKRKWKSVEAGAALVEEGSDAYVTISLPTSAVDQEIEETTFNIGVEAVQGNAETRDILLVEGDTDEARQASFAKLLNELPAVGKSGQYDIELTAGNYYMPTLSNGETQSVTIYGSSDTVVKCNSISSGENKLWSYAKKSLVFDSVTVQGTDTWGYFGMQCASITYQNCTINNTITLYSPTTFTNCVFNKYGDYTTNKNEYCFYNYGATRVDVDNCKFYTSCKALKLYNAGVTEMNISNSYFHSDRSVEGKEKSVLDVGRDQNFTDSSTAVVTFTNNTQEGFYEGIIAEGANQKSSGSVWWADTDVNTNSNGNLKIIVDGVTQYDYKSGTYSAS